LSGRKIYKKNENKLLHQFSVLMPPKVPKERSSKQHHNDAILSKSMTDMHTSLKHPVIRSYYENKVTNDKLREILIQQSKDQKLKNVFTK